MLKVLSGVVAFAGTDWKGGSVLGRTDVRTKVLKERMEMYESILRY